MNQWISLTKLLQFKPQNHYGPKPCTTYQFFKDNIRPHIFHNRKYDYTHASLKENKFYYKKLEIINVRILFVCLTKTFTV